MEEKELKEYIRKLVEEAVEKLLFEGVRTNSDGETFSFDFSTDESNDIISLKRDKPYQLQAFGNTYYYGYRFEDNVDSTVRTKFIHYIKDNYHINDEEVNRFITSALDNLNKEVNLASFSAIIYPESLSDLNRRCLHYINSLTDGKFTTFEMVKSLPKSITFNYDLFKTNILDGIVNGRSRYTDVQKQEVISRIEAVMNNVHQLDYFSIARDIKKPIWRRYIENFYQFKSKEERNIFSKLKGKVLVLDDIITSGATISNILKTIRVVNPDNKIVVFSIIGSNKVN